MLNWGREARTAIRCGRGSPIATAHRCSPEGAVAGISDVLNEFHDRIVDLQRRFLRIIAVGIGCHEDFFDAMLRHGPHLTRHPLPGDGPRSGPGPCGQAPTATST